MSHKTCKHINDYDDIVPYSFIKIASLPQNCIPLCMFLWSSASGYSIIFDCEINVLDDEKSTPLMKVDLRFNFSNYFDLSG